jgi:hypothetical protein
MFVAKIGKRSNPSTGIKREAVETTGISVYPNPFTATLMLGLPVKVPSGRVKVELITLDGKLVFNKEVILNGGRIEVELNIPTVLPAGMYLLHFRMNEKHKVLKVVKE